MPRIWDIGLSIVAGFASSALKPTIKSARGNELAKDTLGKQFHVRMPILQGLNDARDHLLAVEAFLAGAGIDKLVLLPYHSLYLQKFDDFFLSREKLKTKPHTKADLDGIARTFTRVHVSFGG